MSLMKKMVHEIRLTVEAAIPALILVFIGFTLAYQSYDIPSQSMQPTMEVGDRIVVSKFSYGYSRWTIPYGLGGVLPATEGRLFGRPPRRGDVVVFRHPFLDKDFIKRVIGLPGDEIALKDGRVSINGKELRRELVRTRSIMRYEKSGKVEFPVTVQEYDEFMPDGRAHRIYEFSDADVLDNFGPVIVSPNTFFVMGDNRDNSQDSRAEAGPGMVPMERLEGKAETVLFTFYRCRGKDQGHDCADGRWLKPFTRKAIAEAK